MKSVRRRNFRSLSRRSAGVSLTELLVGSILLGASLGVVAELMSLCVLANSKLFKQFDAQVGVHAALERLKRDVRAADKVCSSLDGEELAEFNQQQKNLGASTLVLRIPIYYLSKANDSTDLSYDSAAAQDPFNGFKIYGHYVVVYEVVPDPDKPNEFMLMSSVRRLPKDDSFNTDARTSWFAENSSFRPKIDQQVIVKGIVGPLGTGESSSVTPKVFSYVARNPNVQNRLDFLREGVLVDSQLVNGISMVSVDLEVKRGDSGSTEAVGSADKVVGVHSEIFIRSSEQALGPVDPSMYESE